MTRFACSLVCLLLCALAACGQDEGSGTSDSADAGQWAVVDLGSTDIDLDSFFEDVSSEVADASSVDTSSVDTSAPKLRRPAHGWGTLPGEQGQLVALSPHRQGPRP